MAYALVADVKARAGRLASAWSRDTSPGDADLERFLNDEAASLNAAILGRGLTLPEAETDAALSLRGVNADGALLLALSGTFPAGEGPAAAQELIRIVQERLTLAWESIRAGTHPAIVIIEAADVGAPSASNFWDEEPDYGQVGIEELEELNPRLQPEAERGMVF
jgi:hypothetical protein